MKKLKLSKKDKIAYALIVLLGVIAFIVSTLLLMEPKEADAATDVTYISDGEMMSATVYDLRELSWDYWLTNTQPEVLAWYDNPENLANDIISECNYMVVMEQGFYYFFVEPFYHNSSLTGQNNIFLNYDNGYKVGVRKIDGVPSVVSVVGMYDNHSNADSTFTVMYNGGSCVVGSTYDFLVNCTDSLKDGITRNNLTYPELPLVTDKWVNISEKNQNATAAYMDTSAGYESFFVHPGYSYYFVLHESDSNRKQVVFSTVPFTSYPDFMPDDNGNYWVNLCADGGNVFIYNCKYNNSPAFGQSISDASGPIMRFLYTDQGYSTNCTFGSGQVFSASMSELDDIFLKCINYIKNQGVVFSQYPYYLFSATSDAHQIYYEFLLLEKSISDAPNSYDAKVGSYIKLLYYPKDDSFVISSGVDDLRLYRHRNFSNGMLDFRLQNFDVLNHYSYPLFSNFSFTSDGGTVESPYEYYEAFTGMSQSGKVPDKVVFDIHDNYIYDVTYEQLVDENGLSSWSVLYDIYPGYFFPAPSGYYVNAIHRFVLPSLTYMQLLVGSDLLQSDIEAWRSNSLSQCVTYDFSSLYGNLKGNISLRDALYESLEKDWEKIYGQSFDEDLFEIAMAYCYPEVGVLRLQQLDENNILHIGHTCISYPYKYYDLDAVEEIESEYLEIDLRHNTYGVSLDDVLEFGTDSVIDDYEKLLEELKNKEEELKSNEQELEAVKAERDQYRLQYIALLESSGSSIVDIFDGLVDALVGLPAIFTTLGTIIGSVLSFLPGPITALMIAGLGAWIVVSIVNAVRGK